jgi:hypothetical protein
MKKLAFRTTGLMLLVSLTLSAAPPDKTPLTVAESSDYKATSRYSDVMEFINTLQSLSPYLAVETMAVSTEGRAIPLMILGKPLPRSPRDLRFDSRGVVYIQANIHAGEVEGKEACLMLARDILQESSPALLDRLVILIAPIFNADGNEKISPKNRSRQAGPSEGVGLRYNGQNLDLNRDAIKLESPEMRGLVERVLNRWDPLLLVDCHTTNGSYHQEPVTYVWGFNPNGDGTLIRYMREAMMPDIQKNLKKKYDVLSIPYGNFMDFHNPEKGWNPAGPQPRYLTNYIGLRNRLAILNENYAYSDYKTRVWGCYYFLRSILEHCHANIETIVTLIREADRNTLLRGSRPAETDSLAITYDVRPLPEPVTILGYEMEVVERKNRWPRVTRTDKERVYRAPYYVDFFAKRSVPFPYGYLIPATAHDIVEKLRQHGVVVETLEKPATLEVEAFILKKLESAERLYQGHHMNSVEGEYRLETETFEPGTYFVPTAQPLANIAAYMLEPESDDGLLVWNFFDRYLVRQWGGGMGEYPVRKLLKPASMATKILP